MAWDAADRLADRIAMGAQQAYVADLTAELMRMIADGVADPDRYAAVTRVSRDAAMGCLARHAPTVRGDVMAAFEEALAREDEALVRSLRHARASRAPHGFGLTATAENTVRQAADALAGVIRRQNTALADTMADAYNEAVGEAITRRAMGESVDAAVARAVRQLAARGLTTVDYKSGARTSIDACVRRHVVTQRNKCRNDLLMRRCDEWGQDLVMVSSHYGCRPSHEWFQGQVFSRSGKSGETSASNKPKVSYRPLSDTGYPSDPGGLCGCNCKHSMTPFVPGFSQLPDTEFAEEAASHGGMTSREYYEATQRQRELERRIRSCKREIAWGEAMGKDVAEQRYRLGSLQKAQREHCERNHLKRQPQREKAYAMPDPRGSTAPIMITAQPKALTAARALEAKKRSAVFVEEFGDRLSDQRAAYSGAADVRAVFKERTGLRGAELDDWVVALPKEKRAAILASAEYAVSFVGKPAAGLRLIRGDALQDGVYAQSERRLGGDYVIRLSRKEARLLTSEELEQVVFHEVAHSAEYALTSDKEHEREQKALRRFQAKRANALKQARLSAIIEHELKAAGFDASYSESAGRVIFRGNAEETAGAISAYAVVDADVGEQDSELAAESIRFVANNGYGRNAVADAIARRLIDGQKPGSES